MMSKNERTLRTARFMLWFYRNLKVTKEDTTETLAKKIKDAMEKFGLFE